MFNKKFGHVIINQMDHISNFYKKKNRLLARGLKFVNWMKVRVSMEGENVLELIVNRKTFSFSSSLACRDGPLIITYMGTNEFMDIWSPCSINWRWFSGLLQTRWKISEILQFLRDTLKLTVSHEKKFFKKDCNQNQNMKLT